MRKEIDFGQGRTLVFEDCGPNQFVISMLAYYQAQEGEMRDKRTGRAVKHSVCLSSLQMVDVLKEAVDEWYKENAQGGTVTFKKAPVIVDLREEIPTKGPTTKERLDHLTKELIETVTVVRDTAAMCAQGFRDLEGRVVALEKRPIGKVITTFPPVIGVLGDLPATEDGQPTLVQAARAEAYNEELKKEPKLGWYRVTFEGNEVINATSMNASRPECRDFPDGMHSCIRQATSLRQAIKVSEFERQFGGCKKSTVTE